MRKVNKDFNAPPDALQRGFEEMKENLLERKSEHHFDPRIYNSAVERELKAIYHHKCAYCESVMGKDDFTVEHYRPKSSYYWLGYEWSNLLPVCKKCNNAKDRKFPVEVPSRVLPNSGKKERVKVPMLLSNGDLDVDAMKADHPYLLDEKPHLLHPEIDEPKYFLCVKRTGELTSQIDSEMNEYHHKRAKQTIKLTNLNRDWLIVQRRKIIEGFEYLLRVQTFSLLKFLEKNDQHDLASSLKLAFFIIFKLIESQFRDEQEYTLTGWWTWMNIKEMLFKPIYKDNKEVEQMLDHALELYIKSKSRTTDSQTKSPRNL